MSAFQPQSVGNECCEILQLHRSCYCYRQQQLCSQQLLSFRQFLLRNLCQTEALHKGALTECHGSQDDVANRQLLAKTFFKAKQPDQRYQQAGNSIDIADQSRGLTKLNHAWPCKNNKCRAGVMQLTTTLQQTIRMIPNVCLYDAEQPGKEIDASQSRLATQISKLARNHCGCMPLNNTSPRARLTQTMNLRGHCRQLQLICVEPPRNYINISMDLL